MKLLVVFIFIFLNFYSYCQDINYAHEVIKQLSSANFHGRGYTEKGDKIAAIYISEQLKKWNVKQIDNNYFQTFSISVNTFPKNIFASIDTNQLSLGEDFMIISNSGSCNGTYNLVWLTNENLNTLKSQDLLKSFIVIDTSLISNKTKETLDYINLIKKHNCLHAQGIIDIVDGKRLMQTISQNFKDYPVIQVKKNKISKDSKTIKLKFKNKFEKNYKTQNVVGIIEGQSDSIIVFGAHYDHLGQMGKFIYFPGANDNASGVSMLLNLAEYYFLQNKNTKPKYTIAFCFFSAEEAGILGSEYFVNHPLFELKKIKLMINLDMVGTGDKGITVVDGAVFKKEFNLLDTINKQKNYLADIKARGEARNSDHYFFYNKGIKSIFIYTMGGNSEYHNIYDKEESINLYGFENLVRLITDFVNQL